MSDRYIDMPCSKAEAEWGVNGHYFRTFLVNDGGVYYWNELSDCYCRESDEAVIQLVLTKANQK